MSKIAKIILLSFTLAVLITAGTYFISHSSQVSFAQPLGECAFLPDSGKPLPSQSQNKTSHGFPAEYKQNTPHQLAGGICGPSLEYTHEFSYAYAGLDVLIWWAIVFVIFQVSRPNKKQAK
jgi:hypothetical protein